MNKIEKIPKFEIKNILTIIGVVIILYIGVSVLVSAIEWATKVRFEHSQPRKFICIAEIQKCFDKTINENYPSVEFEWLNSN